MKNWLDGVKFAKTYTSGLKGQKPSKCVQVFTPSPDRERLSFTDNHFKFYKDGRGKRQNR